MIIRDGAKVDNLSKFTLTSKDLVTLENDKIYDFQVSWVPTHNKMKIFHLRNISCFHDG